MLRRTLLGLTVVTGVVDAVSFLGLGHVFTANMTGNVVFLGFALGGARDIAPGRSVAALLAFAAGGMCGGRLSNRHGREPVRSLAIAMSVESLLLCAAAAAAAADYAVIALTATAMGLRNAAVRKTAVPDLTTTVLTLTITGLAADSPLGGGLGERVGPRLLSVAAMGAGACLGAVLWTRFGIRVPLAAAAAFVAAIAWALHRSMPIKLNHSGRMPPAGPARHESPARKDA